MRINPRAQFTPVAWGLLCFFGLVLFVQKLFEFPYLSSGWQGGIFGILLVIFGFVAIEGWWLASQQEIVVGADDPPRPELASDHSRPPRLGDQVGGSSIGRPRL
jgi:hypothetical protein